MESDLDRPSEKTAVKEIAEVITSDKRIQAASSTGVAHIGDQPERFQDIGLARVRLSDEYVDSPTVQINVLDGLEVPDFQVVEHAIPRMSDAQKWTLG